MVSLDLDLKALSEANARRLVVAARLGFLATFSAITVLSLISGKVMSDINAFDVNDKIGHFIAYAWLSLFGMFATASPAIRLRGLLILALYGATLEAMQALLGWDREGSFADMLANMLGLAAGAGLALLVSRLMRDQATDKRQ